MELVDVAPPDISASEVLLKVTASGICQTDVHIRAMTEEWVPRGTILGHEFAGEIVAPASSASGPPAGRRPRCR